MCNRFEIKLDGAKIPQASRSLEAPELEVIFKQYNLSRKMSILANISKKRKFVADGVFYSELNEVCISLYVV